MPTKPSTLPVWDSSLTNAAQPSSTHQSNGLVTAEIPTSGEWNWMLSTLSSWVAYFAAYADPGTFQARLSANSSAAIPTTDQTAVTTLYLQPFRGGLISLYDGTSAWYGFQMSSALSLTVPSTTSTMYDVFVYNNSGTLTLTAVAWTNSTTRATALSQVNGIYVNSSNVTYRYVGSFMTSSVSGQTTDSAANRLVWNYYNRVKRWLNYTWQGGYNTTNTSNAWQQSTNVVGNQINVVVGISEDACDCTIAVAATYIGNIVNYMVAFGVNSTSTPSADSLSMSYRQVSSTSTIGNASAYFEGVLAPGYSELIWLENSSGVCGLESGGAGTNTTQMIGSILG